MTVEELEIALKSVKPEHKNKEVVCQTTGGHNYGFALVTSAAENEDTFTLFIEGDK